MAPGARTPSLARATEALLTAAGDVALVEPMASVLLREERRLSGRFRPERLIEHWSSRALGNPMARDRYRWELTHRRGTGLPPWVEPVEAWRAWRRSETSVIWNDVFAFEEQLTGPIVSCESLELLAESTELHPRAAELHAEAEAILRRDFSQCALERHAWFDTFAIWCLSRHRELFERMQPIAVAVTESYALRTRRDGGVVMGTRFPFHGRALVSASAQLAGALLALGSHLDLVARLVAFVAGSAQADGGFADAPDPADVLTTLVAADLLAACDPSFEPAPIVGFFERSQKPNGFFSALGPDAPWLTAEIARWLERSEQPFAKRFRFPRASRANLDRKTGLPFFAQFASAAQLFRELPGLARASVEGVFIDLIGFREFNNRYGQAMGDEVLAAFAAELRELDECQVVRDGGDEFLIVGAPTSTSLANGVRELQRAWPERFRRRFGQDAPPVLARAVLGTTSGGMLSPLREALGRAIGELKLAPVDPATGVFCTVELP